MNSIQTIVVALITSISLPVFATQKVDKQLPATANNNIEIENVRGVINIHGWDKAQVSVVGTLDPQTEKFIFEQQGNSIVIKIKTPSNIDRGNYFEKQLMHDEPGSNLTINVPAKAKLSFNGISTNIIVNNLQQRTDINTVSGTIKATNLGNTVNLNSVSGDITSTQLTGKINLSTVSGDIEDQQSTGRLSLQSVSGSVNSNSTATEVRAHSVSGVIKLNLAKLDSLELDTVSDNASANFTLNEHGSIKASSVSGDISLNFTKDVQASFRLTSNVGGRIINQLTKDKAIEAKYGPGSKLQFDTGNANGTVNVATVSGNIEVKHN